MLLGIFGNLSSGQKKLGAVFGAAVGLTLLGVLAAVWPGPSNQGYAPEQPIPFSHKLHAGTNKIDCLYCHSEATKSKHATVPPLNTCMNCHRVVKTESPYIKQITQAYEEGRPIEWVRVHELPDFVAFNHKRHVAKGVSCQTCHGKVENMEVLTQSKPLTMGWCLNCHRGDTTPRKILAEVHPELKDPRGHQVAPISCHTCHY